MAQWLRQSTIVTIQLGPFLDETDGKTAEVALAITQPDVTLSKNGAVFAQKNDVNAAVHDAGGWYRCQINATDTGTLGRLIVAVHEAGALPVWREFMVVPANEYDSMVLGTDALEVDGVAIADEVLKRGVSNVEAAADTTSLAALVLAAFESSIAGGVWTIRKTGGAAFVVKTVTLDAAAVPIIGVT